MQYRLTLGGVVRIPGHMSVGAHPYDRAGTLFLRDETSENRTWVEVDLGQSLETSNESIRQWTPIPGSDGLEIRVDPEGEVGQFWIRVAPEENDGL